MPHELNSEFNSSVSQALGQVSLATFHLFGAVSSNRKNVSQAQAPRQVQVQALHH